MSPPVVEVALVKAAGHARAAADIQKPAVPIQTRLLRQNGRHPPLCPYLYDRRAARGVPVRKADLTGVLVHQACLPITLKI